MPLRDSNAGSSRGGVNLRRVRRGEGIELVEDQADPACGGNEFADQFHTLARHLGSAARQSRDVAARPGEAGDEAGRDRLARACHHDRNFARRLLRCQCSRREEGDDEVDLETHQLGGFFRLQIRSRLGDADLEAQIAALHIAGLAQAFAERFEQRVRIRTGQGEDADGVDLRLLRLCRFRPEKCTCHRRAAEQRYELPPRHSITSSARTRIASGTESPSSLAVLRLTDRRIRVGCSTGRSAGFTPSRTFLTK